jgi:hypothetical protein
MNGWVSAETKKRRGARALQEPGGELEAVCTLGGKFMGEMILRSGS